MNSKESADRDVGGAGRFGAPQEKGGFLGGIEEVVATEGSVCRV